MKKYFQFVLLLLFAVVACDPGITPPPGPDPVIDPVEVVFDGVKRAGTTYQLLVYSFADSDGDGIGDFKGIEQHLDYLDELGVSALWLSPIFPASSYHGYDAKDFLTVNPEYGTEDDFKRLLNAAHAKNIEIYIDLTLNHTGKDHPWFIDACADPQSEYRDYYIFSRDPAADIAAGKIPMIATQGSAGYDAGQWFTAPTSALGASGRMHFSLDWSNASAPKVTVTASTEAAQASNPDTSVSKFIYYGDGLISRLYQTGASTYEITLDFESSWGFLVRTSDTSWDGGTKYGGRKGQIISLGVPYTLNNSEAADITFGQGEYYHSHFWTAWMPDLNYGSVSTAGSSPAFAQMTAAVDKWLTLGVDGLRLDAVKHIYHNEDSDENPRFLKLFYDRCNSKYKELGHSDDIYMVGEVFSDASKTVQYYKGLPSVFEFSFWWDMTSALNSGDGAGYASKLISYRQKYETARPGARPATKLSNHDEDRAAESLGRSEAKEKLAAALLLTASGKPFIYQGEELGYWGSKSRDDKWVRSPMKWTSTGTTADYYLKGYVDQSLPSIESLSGDQTSLLEVYKKFSRLRNSIPALASGKMSASDAASSDKSIASWVMTSTEGQRVLVVHNMSDGYATATFPKEPVLLMSNGSCSVSGTKVSLGSYSTCVFNY